MIGESASWLFWQLERYRSYNISKTDLAKNLLDTDIQEKVRRRMESILFNTDLDAIFRLQTEAQTVKSSLQKWYTSCVDIFKSFVDYFGYDVIVQILRTLRFWRKPIVDFRTPRVLQYTFDPSESWRTWPAGVSLDDLTTVSGSRYISSILDGYMAGINNALYEVQHTLQMTKEETMSAFDALWEELQSYRRLGQIDGSFIRYITDNKDHLIEVE